MQAGDIFFDFAHACVTIRALLLFSHKEHNQMQNTSIFGLAIALGSGLLIGTQAIFFDMVGRAVGPFRASLVLNLTGGIVGVVVLAGTVLICGRSQLDVPRITIWHGVICAVMGLAILSGVTFAFQKTGIAGAVATVFLGQMIIGTVIDTFGLSGGDPIPLAWSRVAGLALMVVAIGLITLRS
jgi:transporter family-2 protein